MEDTRLERWRLFLGAQAGAGFPALSQHGKRMEESLDRLYTDKGFKIRHEQDVVGPWLDEIQDLFPPSVVALLQKEAIDRIGLLKLLEHPSFMQQVVPNVQLVANLIAFRRRISDKSKDTLRKVIQMVIDQLLERLRLPTEQSIKGALNRSMRTYRPRHNEIDWKRTILKNLRHYQPEHKTVIPETLVGYGHKHKSLKDIIICIDRSGSMGESVIFSSIFGAVIASIPAVNVHMVAFDTEVIDLTDQLQDPVELLLNTDLGGGTDIDLALGYCQQLITRPNDTILVLISDLCEGGSSEGMRSRMAHIVQQGVRPICLLALSDSGVPYYSKEEAQFMTNLGIPTFGCTPDHFPSLMASALQGQDISAWKAQQA